MFLVIDISIILPIYNIEINALNKCLNSIDNQSVKNFEVILVNDGSGHEVSKFCLDFVRKRDIFNLITIENSGVSVARNIGLENSLGKWICFIDPDDWIDKNYIKDLWEAVVDNEKSEIIISNCYINSGKKELLNNFLPRDYEGEIKDKNILLGQLVSKKLGGYYPEVIAVGVPWCKLFKKEFLVLNNLSFVPGLKRMQDNVFCFECISKASYIYNIKSREYHYRKEEGSASFKYNESIYGDFSRYFIEMERVMELYMKGEEVYKRALKIKRISSFNSYLRNYILHRKNKASYKERKLIFNEIYKYEIDMLRLSIQDLKLMTYSEIIFYFLIKFKLLIVLRFLYLR